MFFRGLLSELIKGFKKNDEIECKNLKMNVRFFSVKINRKNKYNSKYCVKSFRNRLS